MTTAAHAGFHVPPNLSHIAEPLRPLALPLTSLTPDPANARLHPERNLTAVEASLRVYGQRKPIVVRKAGMVVTAGNGTLVAAKRLGWTHVAAVVVDDDPVTATGYAIADNRTAELATWDEAALGKLLQELDAENVDLDALGWSTDDLDALADDLDGGDPEAGEDPGPGEPPPAPVSKPGELYVLGPHRLLCGDATLAEDVARLMAGEQADLVVTDPPYAIYGSSTGVGSDIADDRMVVPFFEGVLRTCSTILPTFGHAYTFADWRSWAAWWEAARRTDLRPKNAIVWEKAGGLGSMYANSYELIGFWAKSPHDNAISSAGKRAPGQRHRMVMHQNVIKADRVPTRERLGHNAAKPVSLLSIFIENSSDKGDLVVDLFLGSGSTLVAAARTGRRCFGLEVSPAWCDVIRRRWGDYARTADLDPGEGAL